MVKIRAWGVRDHGFKSHRPHHCVRIESAFNTIEILVSTS